MPFDYSRFLHALESRARKLRGLSVASHAMAIMSLAALGVMIAIRLLRIPFPYWSLAAFVVPPLAVGAVGYAFGRSSRPRIPHLLLRIDDALGLNARLSSLYELRQRGGSSIFRQRIEAEVRDAATEWRTALPLGRRTILGGSAGACCATSRSSSPSCSWPSPHSSSPCRGMSGSLRGCTLSLLRPSTVSLRSNQK